MQQDPTLYNENWLNGTAMLIQLRFIIVAEAAGMTLVTLVTPDAAVKNFLKVFSGKNSFITSITIF